MSDQPTGYTPTTKYVRDWTARGMLSGKLALMDPYQRAAAFDRWLAAHDEQVRAEAKAEERERIEREILALEITRDQARERAARGYSFEWVAGHTSGLYDATGVARGEAS